MGSIRTYVIHEFCKKNIVIKINNKVNLIISIITDRGRVNLREKRVHIAF